MAELGRCYACGHGRFAVTTTRANKLTLDTAGTVLDSAGSDLLTDITCEHCGHVQFASEDISDTTANALLDHTTR